MGAFRNEYVGVLAAIASSALGGVAGGTTRFAIGASDPVTLGVFRFGVGFLLLLPIALVLRIKWPRGRDWLGVAALGVMYFAFFIVLFNLAFRYTTAARGSLALSTLPLMTMLVGAVFGVEALDSRKSIGVIIAMAGAAVALVSGVADAPAGAWRGDLIMVAATLVMALYSVWSRPFIVRSSPLAYVTAGMGFGSACLAAIAAWSDGYASVASFNGPAMDGGGLSGRVRWRRRLFPLGVRARAHDADPNRHHDDDQSGVRVGGGRPHVGRTDRGQPRWRSPCRVRRNLDCHERVSSEEA
jgi:drug/metabolite transporter (DMT)-like permease